MRSRGAAERASVSGPLHAGVLAVLLTALTGIVVAPVRQAAIAHAAELGLCAAAYVGVWLLTRRPGWGSPVQLTVSVLGAAAGAYFLIQFRHLEPDSKVALSAAIGQLTSWPFPALGWWTPFPNSVATLLEGLLLASIGLALSTQPRRVRTASALTAAVMAAALLVTASRGAWLAVAVGGSVAAASRRLPPVAWTALGATATAAIVAAAGAATAPGVPWFLAVAQRIDRPDRLDVYGHAVTLLRDAPYTGIGGGPQFAFALSEFALLIEVPFLTYAHNLVLDLWLQHGLVGLAAWCGLGAATVAAAVAGERAALGARFRGVWAGLLVVHLHGLTDARQMVDEWTWLPYFVLLGLLAGALSAHRVGQTRRSGWLVPLAVGAAVAAAAIVGRGQVQAAWAANLGAVVQARAETSAEGPERDAYRRAAVAYFTRALERDPNDVPALRRLGLVELARERPAAAAAHLRRAWRLDDSNLTTRKALGLASMWTGDLDLARASLSGLPGIAEELNTWSHWRAARGEPTLAIRAGQVSLALDPRQPEMAAWLADIARGGVAERPAVDEHTRPPSR